MADQNNNPKDDQDENGFNDDLIKNYPRSNRKVKVAISQYGLEAEVDPSGNQTQFISPHGIEFKTANDYVEGDLLKIQVQLPDYWNRKQKFVDYGRVDTPDQFRILGKVVKSEEVGKRGKKKLITVKTLIMDDVDEQVLKTFLQEG